MKFNYYSGLLGYGPKGINGTDGLQGLSLYFTDYDVDLNQGVIETAIENNYVLWSTDEPNTPLPGGRVYVSGDLIINTRGVVYEINKTTNTFTETPGQLSKVDFFTTNNSRTDSGFERWFNKGIASVSTGYIVDNINLNTPVAFNYTDSSIYGIPLNNFTRIESTNVISNNSYNNFTLYSIAENSETDDHQAIALIYDPCINTFRLGNVDNSNNIRNVNITFDVSLLKYNRPFRFEKNTSSGYILTNQEINIPFLFDPNFNSRPSSFKSIAHDASVSISWNLSDFCEDPSIKGDLYFYKDVSYNKIYDLVDVSNGTEIILFNVDTSATVTFSSLESESIYKYHMSIKKDGWERLSDVLSVYVKQYPYYITVTDPVSKYLHADASGKFTVGSTYLYDVDINTVIPIGRWSAIASDDWITFKNPSDPSGTTGIYDFDVSLSRNSGSVDRRGYITLRAEGLSDTIITIDQSVYLTKVSFTNDGSILFNPPLVDQTVSIGIKLYAWSRASAGSSGAKYANTDVKSFKNGLLQSSASVEAISTGSVNVTDVSTIYTISNISNIDNINVTVTGDEFADGPDCEYLNPTSYMEGLGWAEIISVSKTAGTGTFIIDSSKYFYNKRIRTLCALQKGTSTTEPLPPVAP